MICSRLTRVDKVGPSRNSINHRCQPTAIAAHAHQNVERKDGDPYELSIVVVFVPGDDPEAAADEADKVAESVEKAVRARLKDPKVIVLRACFPISEDDLPVSRARVLNQWRLEYMTLKADEVQTGPPNV